MLCMPVLILVVCLHSNWTPVCDLLLLSYVTINKKLEITIRRPEKSLFPF